MGDECGDGDRSSRDFHDIIIVHKSLVEEIDESKAYRIYYLDGDCIIGCN